MMELFYSQGACSMAPHITLLELGMDYKLHKLNLQAGEQKSPEYLAINPKGYVPAVKLDSGEVLTEVAVILQYLADKKPEAKLIPTFGTPERYKAMQWLNFISSEMHKGFSPYFALGRLQKPENVSELKGLWDARMAARLDLFSEHFLKNQYVLGSAFSVADAYLFTVLNWAPIVKFDLSKWPHVLGYIERVRSRPAVQKALVEEGIIPGGKA